MGFLSRPSDDPGKLILRWAVGGVLLFHGVHKLQHGVALILLGALAIFFLGAGRYAAAGGRAKG